MEFEQDDEKAAPNLAKQGVSFDEAKTVFDDPLSAIFRDQNHSDDEARFLLLGHAVTGRLLVVFYTDRGEKTRLISARLATRAERRDYEESNE